MPFAGSRSAEITEVGGRNPVADTAGQIGHRLAETVQRVSHREGVANSVAKLTSRE
jgi:hypothetical protein